MEQYEKGFQRFHAGEDVQPVTSCKFLLWCLKGWTGANFISKINNHVLLDSHITVFLDIAIEYYFYFLRPDSDAQPFHEPNLIH